jgi:hypothetical protein
VKALEPGCPDSFDSAWCRQCGLHHEVGLGSSFVAGVVRWQDLRNRTGVRVQDVGWYPGWPDGGLLVREESPPLITPLTCGNTCADHDRRNWEAVPHTVESDWRNRVPRFCGL